MCTSLKSPPATGPATGHFCTIWGQPWSLFVNWSFPKGGSLRAWLPTHRRQHYESSMAELGDWCDLAICVPQIRKFLGKRCVLWGPLALRVTRVISTKKKAGKNITFVPKTSSPFDSIIRCFFFHCNAIPARRRSHAMPQPLQRGGVCPASPALRQDDAVAPTATNV